MEITNTEWMQGFLRMAQDGWEQGWHERNGGNLTYRLRPEEAESMRDQMTPGPWQPIGISVPGLGGEYFLATGSGKFFRHVARCPEENVCLLELDKAGENYRIVWGLTKGGKPTSELPSHLMNHEVKKRVSGGRHRVIYHAHCTNLIALTFVLPLDDKVFRRCGGGAVDGAWRPRYCRGHLPTHGNIRCGHLGPSRGVCVRRNV